MNSPAQKLLGGLVEIKSLPATDQPAARAEIQARLFSPKGELAVMTEGAIEIRHLAYVELRPGMLRGDHYHQLRHEYFYLISGEVILRLQNIATGERATVQMKTGDLLYIRPGVAHALVPASPGHAIEFAAQPFDLADVYRHPLQS